MSDLALPNLTKDDRARLRAEQPVPTASEAAESVGTLVPRLRTEADATLERCAQALLAMLSNATVEHRQTQQDLAAAEAQKSTIKTFWEKRRVLPEVRKLRAESRQQRAEITGLIEKVVMVQRARGLDVGDGGPRRVEQETPPADAPPRAFAPMDPVPA